MSVAITGPPFFHFSDIRSAVYPNVRAVNFLVGITSGGDFCCESVFDTEDSIKVDHIATDFEWIKPERFLQPSPLEGPALRRS
jgi:hypothetical protein